MSVNLLRGAALCAGASAVLLASSLACASDLTVAEAVWTTNVVNRQYGKQVRPGDVARPLFFWTKLKGGKEAFAALEREGKLPIRHYWTSDNVFGAAPGKPIEPTQEAGDRTLSAGSIDLMRGMRGLVGSGEPFTWRTWTRKQAIWAGTWTVTVLYANGEPVLCDGKPCSYTIDLRD